MSFFFTYEIDDAIQSFNLGMGSESSYFIVHFLIIFVIFNFVNCFVILASFSCHIFKVCFTFRPFFQVLLNWPVIYSCFLNVVIILLRLNSEMKYYWMASAIGIKTSVLPCREFNTKIHDIFVSFYSFQRILGHSYCFLSHFIDHFYWFFVI